jgi:hypothetical protein
MSVTEAHFAVRPPVSGFDAGVFGAIVTGNVPVWCDKRRMMYRRQFLTGLSALGGAALLAGPAQASALAQFRPAGNGDIGHDAFDALLRAHVRPDAAGYNRVDYAGLRGRHGALKAYVVELESAAPSRFSRNAAHAYWINLYNAKTLDVVLDAYPVRSIKDINLGGGGIFGSGPWSRKLMRVEGAELSLDDIEHRIVRPLFADPMSHYGLNCASYSCPNLATRAYVAGNVDQLLAEGAVAYVNHPRGVSVSGGRINASRIYSWYADDFGGTEGLKPHWLRFASQAQAAAIAPARIGGYNYDWSLNAA